MEKTETETMNREVLKTQMYEISSEKITFFSRECFESIQDDWTLSDGSTVSEIFEQGYEKIVLYKNGCLTIEPPVVSGLKAIDDQGEPYGNADWSKILDYLNNTKTIKELEEEASRRHPHSNGIARWGGGATQKFRICNLCEAEIQGTSFCGWYPRTKKSERAEEEHIQGHLLHKGD